MDKPGYSAGSLESVPKFQELVVKKMFALISCIFGSNKPVTDFWKIWVASLVRACIEALLYDSWYCEMFNCFLLLFFSTTNFFQLRYHCIQCLNCSEEASPVETQTLLIRLRQEKMVNSDVKTLFTLNKREYFSFFGPSVFILGCVRLRLWKLSPIQYFCLNADSIWRTAVLCKLHYHLSGKFRVFLQSFWFCISGIGQRAQIGAENSLTQLFN